MNRNETFADFAAAHWGDDVAAPGGAGGQCVDLINIWAIALAAAPIRANAADLLSAASPAEWEVVRNGELNFPAEGDIVVWRESPRVGIGIYGHTAITIVASPMSLITLDQNWPEKSPVAVVRHSFIGVAGWLVRR